MHTYMVSWLSAHANQISHGNSAITLPRPISDMNDVAAVQRMIRDEYGVANPILMSFSRFEEA